MLASYVYNMQIIFNGSEFSSFLMFRQLMSQISHSDSRTQTSLDILENVVLRFKKWKIFYVLIFIE